MDEPAGGAASPQVLPADVASRLFGADTSPEVATFLLDAYRRMPSGEKAARVRALNRLTLNLSLANIRSHHPDADERAMLLHLARRRYGAEFVREIIGWDGKREAEE